MRTPVAAERERVGIVGVAVGIVTATVTFTVTTLPGTAGDSPGGMGPTGRRGMALWGLRRHLALGALLEKRPILLPRAAALVSLTKVASLGPWQQR